MPRRGDSVPIEQLNELGGNSVVRLVFAVFSLVVLLLFVAIIPGFDRLVPGLPVTVGAVVTAALTCLIVGLLFTVAGRARTFLERLEVPTPQIAVLSGDAVYWVVVFLAVVIAYDGFGAAVEPVGTELGTLWLYDLLFFLLGAVPLLLVGYQLYRLLDPLAEHVVERVRTGASNAGQPGGTRTGTTEEYAATGDDGESG